MSKNHYYKLATRWTGNQGTGTSHYRAYERSFEIDIAGKPIIAGSSDPAFLGDRTKYNPEELLIASLSSCHMLWYLHLCAEAGVVVLAYDDNPIGTMTETPNGGGHFTELLLFPNVVVRDLDMLEKAELLHRDAHKLCFIANSVNFPIRIIPGHVAAEAL